MSAQEALVRLAQNRCWLHPSAPGAAEVNESYRLRVIAARREGDLADSDAPAGLADRREARPLDVPRIVIRRQEGTRIFWYSRDVRATLERLGTGALAMTLDQALELRASEASQTMQAEDLFNSSTLRQHDAFEGILLRGSEPIAVVERPSGSRGVRIKFDEDPPADSDLSRAATVKDATVASRDAIKVAAVPELHAFPHVHAPTHATVGELITVLISVSKSPDPQSPEANPMRLRGRPGHESIEVDVRVVADGFDAIGGWHRTLVVDALAPERTIARVKLIALEQAEPTRLTSITVYFASRGVTCGATTRRIAVAAEAIRPAEPIATPSDERGIDWTTDKPRDLPLVIREAVTQPDIEINIAKPNGDATNGNYVCTLRNAHELPVPQVPLRISLGTEAKSYAKQIIDDVSQWDGYDLLENLLQGHGADIAARLPAEFWQLLRDVARHVAPAGRPVTLQFNSAEPYVPWELAIVDPPLDQLRPPMLAAQVVMGRWILGEGSVLSPPRSKLTVRSVAVMAGMYKEAKHGLSRLPMAEAEVMELEHRYLSVPKATRYACDPGSLKSLLDASFEGGSQVVHFAGHGRVDPTRPGDAALFLDNGKPLSPAFFRKTKLGALQTPFIFLNACMVGVGGELLGDFGGFPGACLAGDFSALLAPLWAVRDDVAHSIAVSLYEQTLLAPNRSVAEVLRDLRQPYIDDPRISSYLAYVYYGSPFLTLIPEPAEPTA